jgi:monoamine oxidase
MAPERIIVVGAGIAGLHCAIELVKKGHTVTLYEKYNYVGGRMYTFHKKLPAGRVQWEAGAGRISEKHRLVLGLFKKYGLHTIPIGSEELYKKDYSSATEPNLFEPSLPVFFGPFRDLPAELLATRTIRELCSEIYGPSAANGLLNRFPYRSEIDIMRADLALKLFDVEMKSHEGYFVCREGLSELAKRMQADFVRRGGHIFLGHELRDLIELSGAGVVQATFKAGRLASSTGVAGRARATADRVIIALHASALRHIPRFQGWGVLKHLQMTPLLRVYAKYPTPAWFAGMPNVVTDTPVRYFIPTNAAAGEAMISYTDSRDAKPLMAMSEAACGRYIQKELRRLFPDRRIPEPIFLKTHPWTDGVTYWLPGRYDPAAESAAAIKFSDRIHVCGESFSLRQGWMEGALEHAEKLLAHL